MLLLPLLSCSLAGETPQVHEFTTQADDSCAASISPLLADDPRATGGAVLIADKSARRIGLYQHGSLATLDGAPACWRMALAPNSPPGTKQREGDRATPEGWYRTSDKPASQFPLAIAVHYPNELDAAAGLAAGRIDAATDAAIRAAIRADRKPPQNTALGGEILIHGGGAVSDWTLGCLAMDDADLTRLRAALPAGMRTDLLILP